MTRGSPSTECRDTPCQVPHPRAGPPGQRLRRPREAVDPCAYSRLSPPTSPGLGEPPAGGSNCPGPGRGSSGPGIPACTWNRAVAINIWQDRAASSRGIGLTGLTQPNWYSGSTPLPPVTVSSPVALLKTALPQEAARRTNRAARERQNRLQGPRWARRPDLPDRSDRSDRTHRTHRPSNALPRRRPFLPPAVLDRCAPCSRAPYARRSRS